MNFKDLERTTFKTVLRLPEGLSTSTIEVIMRARKRERHCKDEYEKSLIKFARKNSEKLASVRFKMRWVK